MEKQPNKISFSEVCEVLKNSGYKIKEQEGTEYMHFINSVGNTITIKKENEIKTIYIRDILKKIY